ncbi:hypothetical protein [Paraburkholderia flagellata]|uniref:hypothetical protein n=1 Tax=Paraburkholderia flagellata TaxID=2883241 RepID=UPI001F2D86E0|nr:hypothetical protein [Paraburkholderia flagellata]
MNVAIARFDEGINLVDEEQAVLAVICSLTHGRFKGRGEFSGGYVDVEDDTTIDARKRQLPETDSEAATTMTACKDSCRLTGQGS